MLLRSLCCIDFTKKTRLNFLQFAEILSILKLNAEKYRLTFLQSVEILKQSDLSSMYVDYLFLYEIGIMIEL